MFRRLVYCTMFAFFLTLTQNSTNPPLAFAQSTPFRVDTLFELGCPGTFSITTAQGPDFEVVINPDGLTFSLTAHYRGREIKFNRHSRVGVHKHFDSQPL